jgi:hypothetical protein
MPPPPKGVSPLWLASGEGHLEVAKLLLSHKADTNNKRMDGITALMAACAGGHAVVVELLLGSGADANACVTSSSPHLLTFLISSLTHCTPILNTMPCSTLLISAPLVPPLPYPPSPISPHSYVHVQARQGRAHGAHQRSRERVRAHRATAGG